MAKRGRTNLYRRGTTWWCWGYYGDGKRWRESTKQSDHRAAQIVARDINLRRAAEASAPKRSRVTLLAALTGRLESMKALGKREATIYAATVHCRHLVEHIGADTLLESITLATTTLYVEQRLAERDEQRKHRVSMHTIKKELVQLVAAWKRCARLGEVAPPPDLKPEGLVRVYTPRSRWLTREEFAALARALDESGKEQVEHRSDYLTAWCFTGLRRTELYSYQPGDYDEAANVLKVRGTKTAKSKRSVPLAPEAAEVFARRAERGFPKWGNVRRDLAAACKRAGIAQVTCNDLRRTFASWMCQAGVSEMACAKLMGHSSTAMVKAVYGHFNVASLTGAVAAISLRTPPAPSAPAAPSEPNAPAEAQPSAHAEPEKPAKRAPKSGAPLLLN